jgi:hypothetical protein
VRAGPRELERDRAADAAPGAGDERNLPRQRSRRSSHTSPESANVAFRE